MINSLADYYSDVRPVATLLGEIFWRNFAHAGGPVMSIRERSNLKKLKAMTMLMLYSINKIHCARKTTIYIRIGVTIN